MLNGRSKENIPQSARSFRTGCFHPQSASPARRSHSNSHFAESSQRRELKAFKPLKLSLSPTKPSTGAKLRHSEDSPGITHTEEPALDQSPLIPSILHQPIPPLAFDLQKAEMDSEVVPVKETRNKGMRSDGRCEALQPSNSSSKAQLRTALETAVSALTPRLLALVSAKPPAVEAERVYHVFVGMLTVADGGEAPTSFQLSHHNGWKSFSKLAKSPGKLIACAKSLAKAVKNGTFPHEKWLTLAEELRGAVLLKPSNDDVANAISTVLQSMLSHVRAYNLEREQARRSLDYLEMGDESPRKKLLQSLLNRSTEDKEKTSNLQLSETRGSRLTTEETKSDASFGLSGFSASPLRQNPFPVSAPQIDKVEPTAKPILRKPDQSEIHLNLGKLRTRTPDSVKSPAKITPKTTPRKRNTTKPAEIESKGEKSTQLSALMLEVKLSVFVRERMSIDSFHVPTNAEELETTIEDFVSWVNETDDTIPYEALKRFAASIDIALLVRYREKSIVKDASPATDGVQTSWVQMSLKRDKAKLAVDLRPVRRK